MKVKLILPALTEAKSPSRRPALPVVGLGGPHHQRRLDLYDTRHVVDRPAKLDREALTAGDERACRQSHGEWNRPSPSQ